MEFAFGAGSVPCKQQHIISTEIELARPTTQAGTCPSGSPSRVRCSVFWSPFSSWQFLSFRKATADYPAQHSRNRSFQPRITLINADKGLVNKRNYLATKHGLSQI